MARVASDSTSPAKAGFRAASRRQSDGPSFGDTLKRALGEVSTQQDDAQDYIQRFVRGEPVELHQVMAAAEEAQISLEMLVELRNKMMDAYRNRTWNDAADAIQCLTSLLLLDRVGGRRAMISSSASPRPGSSSASRGGPARRRGSRRTSACRSRRRRS